MAAHQKDRTRHQHAAICFFAVFTAIALLLSVQGIFFMPQSAFAATRTPATYDSTGLQAAINASANGDVIDLSGAPGGIVTLSSALAIRAKSLTFDGGSGGITLLVGGTNRHFSLTIDTTPMILTLDNITLKGRWAGGLDVTEGGGITANGYRNGTFTVQSDPGTTATITNCYTTSRGGGIYGYMDETMPLTVNGLTIENCASDTSGGGIYMVDGYLVLNDVTITNCQARASGGAVYSFSVDSALAVNGGVFSSNTAQQGNGGAFCLVQGTISDASFTDNVAGTAGSSYNDRGGAIYFSGNGSVLTINDSVLERNVVQATFNGGGGGIYGYNNCTLNFNNSSLLYNSVLSTGTASSISTGGGGASVSTMTLNNATIRGNRIEHGNGGGLDTRYAPTFIGTVLIDSNTATMLNPTNSQSGLGGGLYVGSAPSTLTANVSLLNNTADINGGGFYTGASVAIVGTTITGNKTTATVAKGGGGGVAANAITMTAGTVSGNSAAQFGGGLYTFGSGAFTLSEADGPVQIFGNRAEVSGGGLYASSYFTMSGGRITDNEATGTATASGGGAYLNAKSVITGIF